MTTAVEQPPPAIDPEIEFREKLSRLLADCRAIAAYDDHVGRKAQCLLGKLSGPDDVGRPCPDCGRARDCYRCVERQRDNEALVRRGDRLRVRLDQIAQRGALGRYRSSVQRDREQRMLDVLHVLHCIAQTDTIEPLGRAAQALVLGHLLGFSSSPVLATPPRALVPNEGPHSLERAASVIEWLARNHATKRDMVSAVADAFVDPEQLAAWHPAPPPRKPKDDSAEARAALEAWRERYRGAVARAEQERADHGRALLDQAIDAWADAVMGNREHGT